MDSVLLNQLKGDVMSLLFDPCIPRLAAGKAGGEHLVAIFEALAVQAEMAGETTNEVGVHYLEPGDEFKVGKYVPELHLVVRRIEPDDEEEWNDGG